MNTQNYHSQHARFSTSMNIKHESKLKWYTKDQVDYKMFIYLQTCLSTSSLRSQATHLVNFLTRKDDWQLMTKLHSLLLLWRHVYIYAIDAKKQLIEMWHSSLRCSDKSILTNLHTSRKPHKSNSTASLQCKPLHSQESISLRASRYYKLKAA